MIGFIRGEKLLPCLCEKVTVTPANNGESHYPQMEKTWNNGEPSQKWPTKEHNDNDSSKS